MRLSLSVSNQSVESSGITNDYKVAINEFIWNGFEANAHKISVNIIENELSGINELVIRDDGDGINYDELNETFGTFLASKKRYRYLKAKSKVNKGKGRFSFAAFAGDVEWNTIYRDGNELKSYTISVSSGSKNDVDYSKPEKVSGVSTGTEVIFRNITALTLEDLSFEIMEISLLKEFAWFLYLYKDMGLELIFNGNKLDYSKYVNTDLSETVHKSIEGLPFDISIIVWKQSISEKYCCYYFDENNSLKWKDTTSHNRNTINFIHSVYIKSIFFNNKTFFNNDIEESQLSIFLDDEDRKIFRSLHKEIQALIEKKESIYLSDRADKIIDEMEKNSFPRFSDDIYSQMRKNDLKRVTKELFRLAPKIFYKLKPIQEKSFLGFLNLLLSSEERENILDIIEQIVSLTPEQRSDFANMLKKTSLENIIETIKFLEKRFSVIETLKSIVSNLGKYANERDHIQKIIEQHFWLFGEQYHLASADQGMKTALEKYINILYGEKDINAQLKPTAENERRMDIFLCNNRFVETSFGTTMEENVIVELKAPRVRLTIDVYRQIEDYMRIIMGQPSFNTLTRRWKFIAVCSEIDDFIKDRYKTFKDRGKVGLVNISENYEVYAFTWADVFHSFEIKYQPLLEKLKYDREQVAKALMEEVKETEGREKVNALTKKVLSENKEF